MKIILKTPEEQTEALAGKSIRSIDGMNIYFTDGSIALISHDAFYGDTEYIYNVEPTPKIYIGDVLIINNNEYLCTTGLNREGWRDIEDGLKYLCMAYSVVLKSIIFPSPNKMETIYRLNTELPPYTLKNNEQ